MGGHDDHGPSILHVAGPVGRRSFGVGAIVRQLSLSQRSLGVSSEIWSTDDPAEIAELQQNGDSMNVPIRTFPFRGPARYHFSPALERAVVGEGKRFDVFHQHGVWALCTRATKQWRRRFDRATVIAPHGELDPFALRMSPIKKTIARWAYAGENLQSASCFHATGENEVAAIREFALRNPIALIPNAVPEAWIGSMGDGERFRRRHSLPNATRILLFLSRVTPKKGLPLLFEAIAALRRQMDGWMLVIAGPDEFGHMAELRALARRLDIHQLIRFVGPVFGQDKRDALAAAEVFVMPTHSEGSPIAVLEAAGVGLPVLATRGAPCRYLAQYDCGWWVEIDSASVGSALSDALQSSPDRLSQMGDRGREHIRKYYLWSHAAEKTVQLYRWLTDQADPPDFVVCD